MYDRSSLTCSSPKEVRRCTILVLSRKVGERIVIQTPKGNVVIELTDIGRNKVKLGFKADTKIPIWRQELHPIVKGGGR